MEMKSIPVSLHVQMALSDMVVFAVLGVSLEEPVQVEQVSQDLNDL